MTTPYKSLMKAMIQLVCFTFSLVTVASPISRQQAQQNALTFLQEQGRSVAMASLRPALMRTSVSNGFEPYYIFNIANNQGYVIASGDDCACAVLGYANNGNIDVNNIPCNMRCWLDEYERQIDYLQKHNATASRVPKKADNRPTIDVMLTTHWNQNYPYNMYCPIDPNTGTRCLTGCVATAMAQVIYYHRDRSANQTAEAIPSYTTYTQEISVEAIPGGSFIDWDNMTESYYNATESQMEAIANLMKYCGTALRMDYGPYSSSAYSEDLDDALLLLLNYSSKIRLLNRSAYEDEDWEEIIYNELKNSRPVLYSGYNGYQSHEFVCDGYAGNGYYHINWGWGYGFDGFYLLSANDSAGEMDGYSFYQDAVINVEPRASHQESDTGIHFDCPVAKVKCLLNWDVNDDGALSLEEVSAATSIGDMFYRSHISSFNEFGYFTGVTSIDDYAFDECNMLTNITIPNSVTSIGKYAFYDCNRLKNLTIPKSVTSIGENAFRNCDSMTDLTIHGDCVGYMTFYKCTGLKNLTIGEGVKSIGYYAFTGCNRLKNVTIGKDVTTIQEYAFLNCDSLTNLTINGNCIKVGTFKDCTSIRKLTIGEGVTSIDMIAFYNCSGLTSVSLPNSLTNIGQCAFQGCTGLTSITINNGYIDNSAFRFCSNLKEVTLGKSVTSVRPFSFDGDTLITVVTCLAQTPPDAYLGSCFDFDYDSQLYKVETLRVPIEAVDLYKSTYSWSRFPNIVGLDPALGDVNLDGEINIADINVIINNILSEKDNCLNEYMSDVNRDGEVNISDINALIDIILNEAN